MPVNRRHIAYLIPHTEPAGGERVILNLASHLDPERFQASVILPKEGGLSKAFQKVNIPVTIIPFRRNFWHGYPPAFSWKAIREISELLKTKKVDLLHLNDSYLTLLGGMAAQNTGIPCALTAHGIWDAHFWIQDILNARYPKRIWAATEAIHQAILKREYVPKERVKTVFFGINADRFTPAARTPCTESTVFIRIARFDQVKDYPTLLAAMEKVLVKSPTSKLVIIGDVMLDIPTENRRLVEDAKAHVESSPLLKGRVEFLGYQEDTVRHLQAADVLVSSSRSESVGLSLLEGMSCGLAVVSTNVGGPQEIVLEEKTGLLVAPQNPEALAQAMLSLAQNPQQRKAMGEAGRERVLKIFNVKRFVETMQHEYEDLISRS